MIRVSIIIDDKPTKKNKQLMEHLLKNVNKYKKTMAMNVSINPNPKNQIKLPSMLIDNQTVNGTTNIINKLKETNQAKMAEFIGDPVENYLHKIITQKDEDEDNEVGVTKKFEMESQKRAQTAPKIPQKKVNKEPVKQPIASNVEGDGDEMLRDFWSKQLSMG